MANLPESGAWPSGIYQLETTDPVVGGPPDVSTGAGKSNIPLMQLAIRTALLKATGDKSFTTDNSPRQLSRNGYQRLGTSGLLLQWGRGSILAADGNTGGTFITFPISFPTECFVVIPSDYRPTLNLTQGQYFSGGPYTKDGFYLIAINQNGAFSDTDCAYAAIGY